jgi:tetratricopeptide (TPR) repeat protein
VENDPQSPDGYIFRAMAEANQKQPDKAEADLNKAIQLAPQNPLGFAKMGEWRLTQRRYAEAEKFYEQALVRDPNFSDALRGLIATYTEEKQPARALARVQAQITKAPQNSDYYFILGGLQVNKKDFAAAESSLRKAISLDQNNMNAFFLLGQVEVQQGSLDKAIASSYEWIRQNPKDVQAYVLTGSLEDARGDWKKAQDLYKKALEIQPSYPLAENNLAYSMLENGGNADVALSLAQSAHSALPKLAALSDTLAWAYYHKGMYRTTISLLQEALKEEALKPEEKAAYHYHLGLAYEKSNDLPQAKVHLRRALALDDKSAQAELVRKALESIGG